MTVSRPPVADEVVTEPEILFLAGPAVHEDPPPGYRRVSYVGAGPGEPVDVLTVPTGVFVPTSGPGRTR